MNKKLLIICVFIVIILRSFGSNISELEKNNTPNIVIIFTDDQGYQDLGCYGSPNILTPNLDKLAEEGIKFTDFYVASSVCTPSRAALLTGKYPIRMNLAKGVLFPNSGDKGLSPKEETIPKLLKKLNYKTACIGKWHLGHQSKFLPLSNGFDYYYGIPYSNDMWIAPELKLHRNVILNDNITFEDIEYMKKIGGLKEWAKARKFNNQVPLMKNNEVIEFPVDQSTLTKRYTEEVISFINKSKDSPFFIFFTPAMPHVPLYASKDFMNTSQAGLYGDTIEEIDWSVGRILSTLKDINAEKNTLVIFTSDNGPALHFFDHGGKALPLRSGKASIFEGGMRVPCIMKYPSRFESNSVCTNIITSLDILPTILNLCEITIDNDIDGVDILSILNNPNNNSERIFIYYSTAGKASAIRVGKWKLIFSKPVGNYGDLVEIKKYNNKIFTPELYDLQNDPSERNNLYEKYPLIAQKCFKIAVRKIRLLENN